MQHCNTSDLNLLLGINKLAKNIFQNCKLWFLIGDSRRVNIAIQQKVFI